MKQKGSKKMLLIISGVIFILVFTIVLISILPENIGTVIGFIGFGTLFIFALLLMTYFVPKKIFKKAKQQGKQNLALFVVIPGILLGFQWWRILLLRNHGVISFTELSTTDIIQGATAFLIMSGIMNAVWSIITPKASAACAKSQIQRAAKNAGETLKERTSSPDLTKEAPGFSCGVPIENAPKRFAVPDCIIILKSPPAPTDTRAYILVVIKTLYPEIVESEAKIPMMLQVTDSYADEYYIATVAMNLPLQRGMKVDLDKVTHRAFDDADGGKGTVILCYK